MIDTAVAYFNEQEVGKAIKDSGIPAKVVRQISDQAEKYYDGEKAIENNLFN